MFKRENLLFVLATILIFPFLEIYRISPNSFFSIYRIFLPIYIIITGYLLINSIKINFFYLLNLVTFLLFVFINSGDNLSAISAILKILGITSMVIISKYILLKEYLINNYLFTIRTFIISFLLIFFIGNLNLIYNPGEIIPFSGFIPALQLSESSIKHKISLLTGFRLYFPFGTSSVLGGISILLSALSLNVYAILKNKIDLILSLILVFVSFTSFSRTSLLALLLIFIYFSGKILVKNLKTLKASRKETNIFIFSALFFPFLYFTILGKNNFTTNPFYKLVSTLMSFLYGDNLSLNDFYHLQMRKEVFSLLINDSNPFKIIFGHGSGALESQLSSHSHMTLLTGWYDFGLVFIFFAFSIIVYLFKNKDPFSNIYLILFTSCLLFYDFTYEQTFWMIIFTFLLFVSFSKKMYKNKKR